MEDRNKYFRNVIKGENIINNFKEKNSLGINTLKEESIIEDKRNNNNEINKKDINNNYNYNNIELNKIINNLSIVHYNLNFEFKKDNNNDKIKELTELLNEERIKNKNNEIIINKLQNEINEEKNKNKILIEKINNLQKSLDEYKNNFNKDNKINLNELFQNLLDKDKEISKLKSKLSEEKFISVTIMSFDEDIRLNIICKSNDNFKYLENKFYEYNPEYSENKYYFTINGKIINTNLNINENNIHNNDIIILNNI